MNEASPLVRQLHQCAVSAYAAGNLGEAEKLCTELIAANPGFLESLHLLAVVQSQLGKNDKALANYDRALALNPDDAKLLTSRGIALQETERFDEALASHDRALAVKPNDAEALNNRGVTLQHMKRLDEALISIDQAIQHQPNYIDAHFNRGVILQVMGRHDEALASFDRTLDLAPDDPEALNNRGNILHILKRYGEALASYDCALARWPRHHQAWSNRGITLKELRRLDDALASFDRALQLKLDYAFALSNRGNALQDMNRFAEALSHYELAIKSQPDYVDAHYNRGGALYAMGRFDEALIGFERALTLQPDHPSACSDAADCAARICDWQRYEKYSGELRMHTLEQSAVVSPFVLMNHSQDESLHLLAARRYASVHIGAMPQTFARGGWQNDKIRIAYLSPDFRGHPVAQSIAELVEIHDRARFEVIGVSFGPDDLSDVRKRIVAAFDRFYDVRARTDGDAARLLADLRVDIAVDLCGYTTYSRPAIFAHRPAPIQASYFGYSGTTGSNFIDYIVGDGTVLPFESQIHYSEKIVHLPDCFMPQDSRRAVAACRQTRAEIGLPERGFVYCCFNANWKITPLIFDIWMQILKETDQSVLWLLDTNEAAVRNLRNEARARGVDPGRLIFAPRTRVEDHLARQHFADLFLDTLPYNAHTTTAEALWVGLPVLTCRGDAFAGRVAASLLNAVGLNELITSSLQEYKTLALKLARDPAMLADIKSGLARHRDTLPLFDSARLVRHLESAYTTMWEIWQRGETPRSFGVSPL